jgi:hypothetical protein
MLLVSGAEICSRPNRLERLQQNKKESSSVKERVLRGIEQFLDRKRVFHDNCTLRREDPTLQERGLV